MNVAGVTSKLARRIRYHDMEAESQRLFLRARYMSRCLGQLPNANDWGVLPGTRDRIAAWEAVATSRRSMARVYMFDWTRPYTRGIAWGAVACLLTYPDLTMTMLETLEDFEGVYKVTEYPPLMACNVLAYPVIKEWAKLPAFSSNVRTLKGI